MAITASHLEAWMTEAVLQRLDSVEMANALAGQSSDGEVAAELHTQVKTDTDKLAQLAERWADGELDQPQWRAARTRLDGRLTANRRKLAQMRGTTLVDAGSGTAGSYATCGVISP